ncbi:hypothetical protein ACLI1A_10200 [Flavobacterium sp. RHBU_3]|uniref:hypothetical protein n=1 Tax=Flavobacterium sp. RHBU_3 TaxID=3391184 RepID=UPI0039846509
MGPFPGMNFVKPAGPAGAAAPKEPNVTIIVLPDIRVFPPRDAKLIKMLGSFVLIDGARMYSFYHTKGNFDASTEAGGSEDAETNAHKVVLDLPGDSLELNEALAAFQGQDLIVIFGSCKDDFYKVFGTKCAPLRMKIASQDNKDGRKKTVTFEQYVPTDYLPGHYYGSFLFKEPYDAPNTTFDINADNGNQYVVPALDETAAIAPSAVTLTAGQIVTFIGSGGSDPATLTSGVAGAATVLLVDGNTWEAQAGAVIHLQVFDAGTTTYLIEVSRG